MAFRGKAVVKINMYILNHTSRVELDVKYMHTSDSTHLYYASMLTAG